MATQKSFVVKKKKNGYQKLGDSLSDTEIEARRNIEGGDGAGCSVGSMEKTKNEKYATGDGFSIAPPKFGKATLRAFGEPIRVKDEMKIDLGESLSASTSKRSSLYKLYPIEEVSERSSRISNEDNTREEIQKLLEENRARAQNRPMSASRRIKMDKDFEIRKAYFTSEESEMNSAFNEHKAEEVAKVISASQNTRSETTQSDSLTSFKRAQIQRLSHDSMLRYQSRLMRFNEDCSNNAENTCYTDDSLLSIRTYSTTKCNSCCFGNIFKNVRKPNKED